MLWMLWAGCGTELLTISVGQASDVVIVGVPEVPDVPEGAEDLDDLDDLDDLYDLDGIDDEVLPDPDQLADRLGVADWLRELDDGWLAEHGIDRDDVSHVAVVGLTLEVVEPIGADLTFFDRLELWVSADGVPEERVAGETAFLPGVTEIELVTEPVDLTPFALGTGMAFHPVADGWPPPLDTTVRATMRLEVGLTAGGVIGQVEDLSRR